MCINGSLTKIKSVLTVFTLLWSVTSLAVTQAELEQLTPQQAYEKSKLLQWQYKKEQAKPYAKYAADKGNADAAILYSSLLYKGPLLQTQEEYEYALKAAELGNLEGMMKVSSDSNLYSSQQKQVWRNKTEQTLLAKAQQGDSKAMRYLYSFYPSGGEAFDWLKKAANAGNPKAEYMLAKRYEVGDGTFFIPGNREKEIKRLYKEAAEAGYPPAMSAYGYLLREIGEKELGWSWILKRANIGDAQTILEVADIYSGMYKPIADIPQDKIKAAGYFKIYYESMDVDLNLDKHAMYYEDYQKLLSIMTAEQKSQANKFAQDYLATHTVRAFDGFWQWGVDYGVKPEQDAK